uniref:RNA-binding cell elongation regulator Jag/EloR n=1 Tax=Methanobrevibacter sp. TaxID=66852 RepID=UPI00388E4A9D
MDYIQVSAKTVEDAVLEAAMKLATTREHLEYEVIEKGSAGFLGFGAKPAVIKARALSDEEIAKAEVKAEPVKEVVKQEVKKEIKKEVKKAESVKVETVEKAVEEVKAPVKKETVTGKEISAEDFLKDVFKAMDMVVDIKVTENKEEKTMDIELSGDEMGVLIGKRGQTLDSLQYLVSLVVNKYSDEYIRVKIDTENYRERRKETLENLARNIAYKVKRTRKTVSLEPMNPYERRVIHSALQNDRYVTTHSEGEEPYRRVVVT